ncbi:hypothetical protein A1359_12845 [Methylomonas lenta]|uniref:Uncharacterized protein n=1 Tax=Methylomonas lenta TaxID=980561 RepID=A0A177N512_9GAMM|nr:hypothetical protein A1359_12845 [Methylomonas lenta]
MWELFCKTHALYTVFGFVKMKAQVHHELSILTGAVAWLIYFFLVLEKTGMPVYLVKLSSRSDILKLGDMA